MLILYILTAYLSVGFIFSAVFITLLIGDVDRTAEGSPWTFRLLILPGCVALWPILLYKYKKISRMKK